MHVNDLTKNGIRTSRLLTDCDHFVKPTFKLNRTFTHTKGLHNTGFLRSQTRNDKFIGSLFVQSAACVYRFSDVFSYNIDNKFSRLTDVEYGVFKLKTLFVPKREKKPES